MIVLKFKKLAESAIIPNKKFDTDSAYDLYSTQNVIIPAGDQRTVKTDIQLAECPPNMVLQIWPRSGLDAKFALHTGAGVVDASYRGEMLVLVKNMGQEDYEIKVSDKIAQFIPITLPKVTVEEVFEATATARGEAGGITEFKASEVELIDGPEVY